MNLRVLLLRLDGSITGIAACLQVVTSAAVANGKRKANASSQHPGDCDSTQEPGTSAAGLADSSTGASDGAPCTSTTGATATAAAGPCREAAARHAQQLPNIRTLLEFVAWTVFSNQSSKAAAVGTAHGAQHKQTPGFLAAELSAVGEAARKVQVGSRGLCHAPRH